MGFMCVYQKNSGGERMTGFYVSIGGGERMIGFYETGSGEWMWERMNVFYVGVSGEWRRRADDRVLC